MNLDGTISNFLQLIKNLLTGINDFSDITNSYIDNISDKTTNGVGNIFVYHVSINNIMIRCDEQHYYMAIGNKNSTYNYSIFNEEKQTYIKILLNKFEFIDHENYIFFDIQQDYLPSYFLRTESEDLKIKLIQLALTNKYNSDVRRRVTIDLNANYFKKLIVTILSKEIQNKFSEYKYISNNFNVLSELPFLNLENLGINENVTEIDLNPIKNIKIIPEKFLENCNKLTTVDLTPLSNVEKIEYGFLTKCSQITYVDLSHMTKIISIEGGFMSDCTNIVNIKFPKLINVNKIDRSFLSGCENLTDIDLTPFQNVVTIDTSFLSNCKKLTHIELSPFKNVTKIGSWFLSNCHNLKYIDLSPFENVVEIDYIFLTNCYNLTYIDLSHIKNLKKIGYRPFSSCTKLTTIKLSKQQIENGVISNEDMEILKNKIVVVE